MYTTYDGIVGIHEFLFFMHVRDMLIRGGQIIVRIDKVSLNYEFSCFSIYGVARAKKDGYDRQYTVSL